MLFQLNSTRLRSFEPRDFAESNKMIGAFCAIELLSVRAGEDSFFPLRRGTVNGTGDQSRLLIFYD
jgi:hypothetical protein